MHPGPSIPGIVEPDELLQSAELFFKFAFGLSAAIVSTDDIVHLPLSEFSWGRHRLIDGEMELSKTQERVASSMLEHVATFVVALQLDQVLEARVPHRFHHADPEFAQGSLIVRQLRNSFAHDPFNPIWHFGQPEAKDRVLEVPGVLLLDTRNLEGERVRWSHFGGPLALLRLLQHLRRRLLTLT